MRVQGLIPFAALALIAFLAFLGFRQAMTLPVMSVPQRGAPSSASPQAAIVQIDFPSQMVIVTHTPEPTGVPTPTYAVPPTPRPLLCGPWLVKGDACTMPPDPEPTPTPLPDCPVAGGLDCVYMGPWDGTPVATTPASPGSYVGM